MEYYVASLKCWSRVSKIADRLLLNDCGGIPTERGGIRQVMRRRVRQPTPHMLCQPHPNSKKVFQIKWQKKSLLEMFLFYISTFIIIEEIVSVQYRTKDYF